MSLGDDDMLLAAELALGLLDAPERAAAEARLTTDAEFSADHRRWQDHAAAMLDQPPVDPRPSLWSGIVAALPANDDRGPPTEARRSVRYWQASTAVAAAAAIVLGVASVYRAPPPAVIVTRPVVTIPAPPLVAVLAKNGAVVTVSYDRATGRLVSAPSRLEVGGHAAQLWVIPGDGTPRSLGLIGDKAPSAITAPAGVDRLIASGATLAISLEPAGGSPTGLPTGPVVLTGRIVAT